MKIRIQGNSLRLRVTQSDVAQLCTFGLVESSIELSPGRPLRYVLQRSPDAAAVSAGFDGGVVHVSIPARVMAEWAGSDQVGIESESQTGVELLIEKDFQCLHRAAERDPDAYARPTTRAGVVATAESGW